MPEETVPTPPNGVPEAATLEALQRVWQQETEGVASRFDDLEARTALIEADHEWLSGWVAAQFSRLRAVAATLVSASELLSRSAPAPRVTEEESR